MGQYQQWLYTQEMDRRLQTEVEALETELLYLKDRVGVLEQTLPETENAILQALFVYQRDQADWELQARANSGSGSLPRWSNSSTMETPQPPVGSATPYHVGQGLKPENMLTLLEKRAQANAGQGQSSAEEHPLDPETRLQNENIRRWFERWHRDIVWSAPPPPEGRRDER